MLITCTKCATSYDVTSDSLGPAGRSVRCARCQNVWFAANTDAMAAVAMAHQADVAAFSAALPGAGAGMPMAEAPPDTTEAAAGPTTDPLPAGTADEWTGKEAVADPVAADIPSESRESPPELIADAPPLVPADEAGHPPAIEALPLEDIESVAARRAKQQARRGRWPQRATTTAVLALIAANIALLAWRADVVLALPQTAKIYAAIGLPVNLRGLVFTDVTTGKEVHEGVPVLVVEGTIENSTPRAAEVPRLRFAVRDGSGQEIYSWTALPTKSVLARGETLAFRSRLASPPAEGHQVLVRFFNRRDLVAGLQ